MASRAATYTLKFLTISWTIAAACTAGAKVESHETNSYAETIFKLIDSLPPKKILSRNDIETALGTKFAENDKGPFIFYEMESADAARTPVRKAILRTKGREDVTLTVMTPFDTCVHKKDVLNRFPMLHITEAPRGHSVYEETVYSVKRPWGLLSFGFSERKPDCVSTIIWNSGGF